jgi:hypothetical protein
VVGHGRLEQGQSGGAMVRDISAWRVARPCGWPSARSRS